MLPVQTQTSTKTKVSVIISSSLMLGLSAVSLFTAWSSILAVAGFQIAKKSDFHIASVGSVAECSGQKYAYENILNETEFSEMQVGYDEYIHLNRRGPYVRVLVPKLSTTPEAPMNINSLCNKYPGQACPNKPFFYSGGNEKDPQCILKSLYPHITDFSGRTTWPNIRDLEEKRVYYDCVIQSLRQYPGQYGFECMSWKSQNLKKEEISEIYNQLKGAFFAPLSYIPDGTLSDGIADNIHITRSEEAGLWQGIDFQVVRDIVKLDQIADKNQLDWLTGYDLNKKPLLYVIPRPGVDTYCNGLRDTKKLPNMPCLTVPIFISSAVDSGAVTKLHEAAFRLFYPDEVNGIDAYDLIRRDAGYYHFGVIWQDTIDGNGSIFRFQSKRFQPNQEPAEVDMFTQSEMEYTYRILKENFAFGDLNFVPDLGRQEELARAWENPIVPVIFSDSQPEKTYEMYNYSDTVNYGYIKRYSLDPKNTVFPNYYNASANGEFGWKDILVTDKAPADVEIPIAGIITSEQQQPLSSHLSLRMARRGTPNAYVKDALAGLRFSDGTAIPGDALVKIVVSSSRYEIFRADLSEAEAWWDSHKIQVQPPRPVNKTEKRILNLKEMTDEPTSRFSRYGAKASNLSILYKDILPEDNQLPALAIPFYYFYQFMNDPQNTFPDITNNNIKTTYAKVISNLLDCMEAKKDAVVCQGFREKAAMQKERFDFFVENAKLYGKVSDELVNSVRSKILEIWPDWQAKEKDGINMIIRARSSSNMEDGGGGTLEFNGAGLYNSTSICLHDEFIGPYIKNGKERSFCDYSEAPRTIRRALSTVWASIYNFRAFQEREYYGLDHRKATMAVLINTGYPDEVSNGVAFTGNPQALQISPDVLDYVINVQYGSSDVVKPAPGVTVETDIIRVNKSTNRVEKVMRTQNVSSIIAPGDYAVSEEELMILGQTILSIDKNYRIEQTDYPSNAVIKDIEFKFVYKDLYDFSKGTVLKIKQVRPYLIVPSKNRDFFNEIPAPPANLTVSKNDSSHVRLAWLNQDDFSDQIFIERKISGGAYILLDTTGSSATSYIDDISMAGSGEIVYRVFGENSNGVSSPSNEVLYLPEVQTQFLRGDADGTGEINLTDAVYILQHLFQGGPIPSCMDAADVNDDGSINITDPINLLQYLFMGSGVEPPAPGPITKGVDPTVDDLGCGL